MIVKEEILSDEGIAWENVQIYYTRVKTLDEINPKAMKRAGKQMQETLKELLDKIKIYDEIRGNQ